MSEIGAVIGRIPSGIFILTARHNTQQTGMLASWVMQASFEPPMFTVAVKKTRYLTHWLQGGARVALNILSNDEKHMIAHFGRGFQPDENAFEEVALLAGHESLPILAESVGFLEGSVVGQLETGDHIVFAVEVEDGRLLKGGHPMTHIRKDGTHY